MIRNSLYNSYYNLPKAQDGKQQPFGPPEGVAIYHNPRLIGNKYFFNLDGKWYSTNSDNTAWVEKPLNETNQSLTNYLNKNALVKVKKGKDKGKVIVDERYIAADPTKPADLDSNRKVPTGNISKVKPVTNKISEQEALSEKANVNDPNRNNVFKTTGGYDYSIANPSNYTPDLNNVYDLSEKYSRSSDNYRRDYYSLDPKTDKLYRSDNLLRWEEVTPSYWNPRGYDYEALKNDIKNNEGSSRNSKLFQPKSGQKYYDLKEKFPNSNDKLIYDYQRDQWFSDQGGDLGNTYWTNISDDAWETKLAREKRNAEENLNLESKPSNKFTIYKDENNDYKYYNPNNDKWYLSRTGYDWNPIPSYDLTDKLKRGEAPGEVVKLPETYYKETAQPIKTSGVYRSSLEPNESSQSIAKPTVTPNEEIKKESTPTITSSTPTRNSLFDRYKDKYKRPVLNKETGLPEPPPYVSNEPEIKNVLDLGNNTYVYKDGDNWYSGDSGNRIYDPKVTEQFNKLFDIQKSQPSSTKPEVASVSPTIVNNYTYNTENNRWYDKDNKEIKDPVLISELQSEKGKRDIVQELLNTPSVNRRVNYVTPNIVTNVPEEDLDTYVDPNKLKITKEYLGNLDKEIEYSPSNKVAARTPKEKRERQGRDYSFEFPDLSGAFTRRTKSKPDQKLTPAELQEYTVEDIYNPNNFTTLDVIKGENISNLPSTYIPESVIPTMQSQYPIVLKEDPNAPVRIIRREIDAEAPGGMGLAGFIHKPRQMKNKFQKRYGGELTDDDFDYTLDVDTNELIEYLKGGHLPKAQTSLDLNNFSIDESNFNTDYKKKEPIDYFKSDKSLTDFINKRKPLNTLNTLSFNEQPEVSQSNVYKMPEVVENLPSVDVSGMKITSPKSYTPTVTNVPGLGNVADRYQYEDTYNYKYNPRRIYDPSNQISYTSGFAPLAYNIGKGWMEKPEYVKTVFTPTPITEYAMGPNYLAVDESLARIRDAVNEQAGTGSRRLNTLIGTYMQGAKQKGEIARVAEANRLAARKEADAARALQQRTLDTAMQQNKVSELSAKVAQEAFREKTVEQIDQLGKQYAKALGQEKADRLKIQATNQLVKDYELIYNPSTGEAKYKHIPSGTYMTQDAYTKMITDSVNKMNADALAKAKEKEASTNESIKAKQEQDKAKSTATNTNTTTQANKFGGWIKENQQYKKRRNRLYY